MSKLAGKPVLKAKTIKVEEEEWNELGEYLKENNSNLSHFVRTIVKYELKRIRRAKK